MTRPAHLYRLHQLLVGADCELPFLREAESADPPDLTLDLRTRSEIPAGAQPWYRSDDPLVSTEIDRAGDALVVRFADGTAFLVGEDGKSIAVLTAPAAYVTGDLAAYALGPVLAIALHLRGSVLLHASAVVLDGRAVLFAGEGGSGKSTTAAMLAREGYAVLADDLTEVTAGMPHMAIPSTGLLRLWSDSVRSLYGDPAAFPDRAPSWDKKMIVTSSGESAVPIGAILLLQKDRHGPSLERVAPREAWTRLMTDSFTAPLPGDAMSRRIFDVTTSLADRVPAYHFHPPPLARSAGLGAWLEQQLQDCG